MQVFYASFENCGGKLVKSPLRGPPLGKRRCSAYIEYSSHACRMQRAKLRMPNVRGSLRPTETRTTQTTNRLKYIDLFQIAKPPPAECKYRLKYAPRKLPTKYLHTAYTSRRRPTMTPSLSPANAARCTTCNMLRGSYRLGPDGGTGVIHERRLH